MSKQKVIHIICYSLLSVALLTSFIMIFKMNQRIKEAENINNILAEEIEAMESKTEISTEFIGNHVLTFYTHTGNRTSSGVYPKAGRTVAVDTNYIPHGTVLYIEGVGLRIAEDTGGDIKGNRLDVFVDTKEEAIQKGVKKAKVHVIKGVKKK